MNVMGILQNMGNPSLDPTPPDGSELPNSSYGGEGCSTSAVFLRIDIFSQYGEVTHSILETHVCSIDMDYHWLR